MHAWGGLPGSQRRDKVKQWMVWVRAAAHVEKESFSKFMRAQFLIIETRSKPITQRREASMRRVLTLWRRWWWWWWWRRSSGRGGSSGGSCQLVYAVRILDVLRRQTRDVEKVLVPWRAATRRGGPGTGRARLRVRGLVEGVVARGDGEWVQVVWHPGGNDRGGYGSAEEFETRRAETD